MTTIAIIQARLGSSRLPGKVLLPLAGKPILAWVIDGARAIHGIDNVVVATTSSPSDDAVADWCETNGILFHRGPEDDVLKRFHEAALRFKADVVMRLTADCPLLDPAVCGQVLMLFKRTLADYAASCNPPSWPDGLDCEVFTFAALDAADKAATRPSDREHVTPFIRNNRYRFKVESLIAPLPGLTSERWTVDYPEDLTFLEAVLNKVKHRAARPSYLEVLSVLDENPKLRKINADTVRNEGLAKSVVLEKVPSRLNFDNSNALRSRAEKVVPLASQTFSKAHIQYPSPDAPLFLTHGEAAHVWDVDGNEFVDLVGGLLPIVIGYQDQDIDNAIRRQLSNGISFSLATELEAKLAEQLVQLVPCAEMVRYGKNGTDATSAAIRVARAHTGRERVAVCGYHGWQDWYIGATVRNKGVPHSVRDLTHTVPYNDAEALDALLSAHPEQFACLIMEPMNAAQPKPGYLQAVRDITAKHGALLVFDEVITGFRYALGGAQSLFGVTPDLASFGKAMGNGMPIAAIVGKEKFMREMEEIFFSSTFGGEALSLAAALAVVDKMRREPIIERLWTVGQAITDGARALFAKHGLDKIFSLNGSAPWMIVGIADHPKARKEAIKTLWVREMLRAGVLVNASHNVCSSLSDQDVLKVLAAYDSALSVIAAEIDTGTLESRLGVAVIEPVFKVR